jgi:4-hydroxybenzoate polyprenyltransferase
MKLSTRLRLYAALTRLDKPIGILLLLWPTLWGLWLASNGRPDSTILGIFVAGVVLMRSAGCAVNDYADRHIDPHVARTRDRPLARGRLSSKEALLLAAGLALAAFVLILPLNTLTLQLSVVALVLATSYPFTKRFLAIPQAYLGIAFGFGIPMAYAAQTGMVPLDAWLLLLANVFWAIAYDTEYAMVDRADDLKLGIRTSAITFGRFDLAAITLCYAGMLGLLGWTGKRHGLEGSFWGGLVLAGGIALYHLWLIRTREPAACFRAFLHNTWLGAAVFAGIAISLL